MATMVTPPTPPSWVLVVYALLPLAIMLFASAMRLLRPCGNCDACKARAAQARRAK